MQLVATILDQVCHILVVMMSKFQKRRAAVLAAILICLVAVNVHAAAHLDAGSVECEFCSTYHDPLDVIVAAEANSVLLPPTLKPFEQRMQHSRVAPCFSVQQRGPPSSIS
jgi:hypothetical protein